LFNFFVFSNEAPITLISLAFSSWASPNELLIGCQSKDKVMCFKKSNCFWERKYGYFCSVFILMLALRYYI
jgi:hypothetical protein